MRHVPSTAIEVRSASSDARFKLGELGVMHEVVELHACNSGKHAANLLDSSTEVVVADMGHRLQNKGDFVGLGISDYGVAFFDEGSGDTAHHLSEFVVERTQAILGHVVESTSVKTDAHGKSRDEGSFRFDTLVFLHEDVQV